MTNHWNDLANSDCVMIIGCNPAENHPVSFKWITKAMDKGAKLIVVDPRFTRSAAKADLYVRLRPGTDIALMGGLINYVLENNLFHKDYVANYTNAAFVVNKDFAFQTASFPVMTKKSGPMIRTTWSYELDAEKKPVTDPTLANPRCVFQMMKTVLRPLHPGNGRPRSPACPRSTSWSWRPPSAPPGSPARPAPCSMPWAAPSIPPGFRSSAATPSCSSCWGTWGSPAAASTPCGGRTTSRAPRTWRCCSTRSRAIWPFPAKPPTPP